MSYRKKFREHLLIAERNDTWHTNISVWCAFKRCVFNWCLKLESESAYYKETWLKLFSLLSGVCLWAWPFNLKYLNHPSLTTSSSMVMLARPLTQSSLKITNRSFCYTAPCLWNKLRTELASLVKYSLLHFHLSHMAVHHLHHLHDHHFRLLSLVQSFTLTSRLGSLVDPLHRIPLLYHTDSTDSFNHSVFFFCSTAGFVCMVC